MAKGMKRYRSHKIVEAGEIMGIVDGDDTHRVIVSAGMNPHEDVHVPADTFSRGRPTPGDYLVRYEDGYLSWSPKRAFEDGYTMIEEEASTMVDEANGVDGSKIKSPGNAEVNHLLSLFEYRHLPVGLQMVSSQFHDLAQDVARRAPDHFETVACLRKLVEAKDCAVRAAL